MTALAKTNSHARVRLTVRKWKMTTENRAQATTRAASPRKVWRPSAWCRRRSASGPWSSGTMAVGSAGVESQLGAPTSRSRRASKLGQAPHAP